MRLAAAIGGAVACTVATVWATGCGFASSSRNDDATSHASSAIIKGTADDATHDSVVLLALYEKDGLLGSCTGTLVAPNLVLTARHCVTETDRDALCKVDGTPYQGGRLYEDFVASSIYVYTGNTAIRSVEDRTKAAARGARLVVDETSETFCASDIAFILLDRSVPSAVAPLRLKEGGRLGESITAVGWGLTEVGRIPNLRLKRSGVKVELVGPHVEDSATKIGIASSEFVVGEAFCSGDSGGPAFASTGAVVGVVSRGGGGQDLPDESPAAGCVGSLSMGIYTHLGTKAALVKSAFDLAGYPPREEGSPPGAGAGATCNEDVDCASNVCHAGTCAVRCDDGTSCGEGEVCTTKGKVKICTDAPKPVVTPSDDDDPVRAPPTRKVVTTTDGCSISSLGASRGTKSDTGGVFGVLGLVLSVGTLARRSRYRRQISRS